MEIVVSDDGSTDATWDILNHYAKRDDRIRLLPRAEKLGVTRNFAQCFAACNGDLISPCDQDDIWHPEKTDRLVSSMGDALLVYCNSRFVDEAGQPAGNTVADTLCMVDGDDPRPFLFSNSVLGHAMLFRKHLLAGDGAITHVPHDWWLAFVAASLGYITYLDEVLVDYRRHDTALTLVAASDRSTQQRQMRLTEDALRLKAMAEFPSPHQAYARRSQAKWLAWHSSYFDPRMFASVLLDAKTSHRAFLKEKTALRLSLKYLAGHRLKRLCLPGYYPELESRDDFPEGNDQ